MFQYLHDEHALDMCSPILATVSYQITHVSDEAGLATASLSHNHHWDVAPVGEELDEGVERFWVTKSHDAPESHLYCQYFDDIINREHIGRIWILNWLQTHHPS